MRAVLVFLLLISTYITYAQCDDSNFLPHLDLNSQNEVDNFTTNYPNCTDLPGGLIIRGAIDDLRPLLELTSINGYIQILNTELKNLEGLSNISIFNGGLTLEGNEDLTDISSLSSASSQTGLLERIRTYVQVSSLMH